MECINSIDITANNKDDIPPILRDRLEIINLK